MKVTVAVPSYNHAPFLRDCLESVVAQTYDNWELIVVDDRSQDDSVQIAASFRDPRIIVEVNPENVGTYATQNRCLDLSSGDVIAILNSDDYWHPEKLTRQIGLLEKYPDASLVYSMGLLVDGAGKPFDVQDHHIDWPSSEHHDVLPYLFSVNRILASTLMFRKGFIQFDPSLRYSGDWVAALKLARTGMAAFSSEPLSYWRQHATNAHRQLLKTLPEEVRVRRAILSHLEQWFTPHSDHQLVRDRLAQCALALGALYILAGDARSARHAHRIALKLQPKNKTAWKRQLATFLPPKIAVSRIWPHTDAHHFVGVSANQIADPIDL